MCSNFKLAAPVEYTGDSNQTGIISPDLCLYVSRSPEDVGRDNSALGGAELFVQIKGNEYREDPFTDSVPDPDSASTFVRDIFDELEDEDEDENEEDDEVEIEDTYTRNRGEIAIYAAELCSRQFRTHCFSISIYGRKARFFRWDRAGVVISESFDIRENPETLCRFIRQYTFATDARRGYDTTISRASEDEEIIFVESIRKHIKEQLSVNENELNVLVKEHYEPGSVYKMPIHPRRPQDSQTSEVHSKPAVSDEAGSEPYPWDELWHEVNKLDTESATMQPSDISKIMPPLSKARTYSKTQYFLVSRPVASPLKATCRGTRGYWSVKIPDHSAGETDHVIAFVKDTWREVSADTDIEGEVAIENVESGVRFVSDIYCHGEVRASNNDIAETDCSDSRSEDCMSLFVFN